MTGGENRFRQLGRRRRVRLLLQDFVGPRAFRLRRALGKQRQLAQREDCCRHQPREAFRHATSVKQRACLTRNFATAKCELRTWKSGKGWETIPYSARPEQTAGPYGTSNNCMKLLALQLALTVPWAFAQLPPPPP